MPALSPSMEEVTLARWLVKEGDRVAEGQVIAEVEADKATLKIEATDEGTVGRLLIPEGAQGVKVNTPILLLGEAEAAPRPAPPPPAPTTAPPATASARPAPPAAATHATNRLHMREALRAALAEEMRRDSRIVLIGRDLVATGGAYRICEGLVEAFGEARVLDAPAAGPGLAGLAVGASAAGLRPVVELASFAAGLDLLGPITGAARRAAVSGGAETCPVVFRGPQGPGRPDLAGWLARIPGLTVVAPHGAADAKGLLKAALRGKGPVAFLEDEAAYGSEEEVPADPDHLLPLGTARIVRPGDDVTLVAFGRGTRLALEAAATLAAEGISAEVLDLRCLRPLDRATLTASVRRTNRCVVVDPGWPVAGFADHVASLVGREAFDWLDAPVGRVADADDPIPYAPALAEAASLGPRSIHAAARAALGR